MHVDVEQELALEGYQQAIRGLRAGIKRHYDRSVNKDLARQQSQGLMRRNVELVLKQLYQDSLKDLRRCLAEGGVCSAEDVLLPLDGVVEELLEYVLQKHRSTCALSNFPNEHNPSQAYLTEVITESSTGWAQFRTEVEATIGQQAG